MKFRDLVLMAYCIGGGELRFLSLKEDDISEEVRNLSEDEVERVLISRIAQEYSLAELSIFLDVKIWFNIPWDIGVAAFWRMFELGSRDPDFLGNCSSFFGIRGGIDGDILIEEMKERLKKEGNEVLCIFLTPDSSDGPQE